jgi:hypothetical protein
VEKQVLRGAQQFFWSVGDWRLRGFFANLCAASLSKAFLSLNFATVFHLIDLSLAHSLNSP